jgi:hypothetical protein
MLYKQDQLRALEEQLQEIDRSEKTLRHLGSLRRDENAERRRLLGEMEVALCEYGM